MNEFKINENQLQFDSIKENSEIENAKDICSETNSLNQCEKLILGEEVYNNDKECEQLKNLDNNSDSSNNSNSSDG